MVADRDTQRHDQPSEEYPLLAELDKARVRLHAGGPVDEQAVRGQPGPEDRRMCPRTAHGLPQERHLVLVELELLDDDGAHSRFPAGPALAGAAGSRSLVLIETSFVSALGTPGDGGRVTAVDAETRPMGNRLPGQDDSAAACCSDRRVPPRAARVHVASAHAHVAVKIPGRTTLPGWTRHRPGTSRTAPVVWSRRWSARPIRLRVGSACGTRCLQGAVRLRSWPTQRNRGCPVGLFVRNVDEVRHQSR